MFYEMPPLRPPSEAYSLLIRATRGCPWNQCAFCSLYAGTKFEIRPVDDIKQDIRKAKEIEQTVLETAQRLGRDPRELADRHGFYWVSPGPITAFIGDSNSLVLRTADMVKILRFLYETFPNLERVTSYGRASTILRKSLDDLILLRQAGLSRLHVGLETGDDFLLTWLKKGVTAAQMIATGQKVRQSGISLSEYIILGLGGRQWGEQHARGTARVLNAVNPDFIRARTLMVYPDTLLAARQAAGEFEAASPVEILREERLLIENLETTAEFVSDHVSNYVSVDGQMPQDKPRMLRQIDDVLQRLAESPDLANQLLQPEYLRRI